MIDIISLIIAITALSGTILHTIRHSRCCYGLVDIDMKKQNTPPSTPINNHSESVALLSESKSEAILIPEKPKIKNWL